MNGCLLDTNVALIGLATPEQISPAIRRAAERGPLFLSVVSYWEVMLKSMKGQLDVGDQSSWWSRTLDGFAAMPLLLRPEHVTAMRGLKRIHQDPFDRILIAQAMAEKMTLLTTDRGLSRYASASFRIIT